MKNSMEQLKPVFENTHEISHIAISCQSNLIWEILPKTHIKYISCGVIGTTIIMMIIIIMSSLASLNLPVYNDSLVCWCNFWPCQAWGARANQTAVRRRAGGDWWTQQTSIVAAWHWLDASSAESLRSITARALFTERAADGQAAASALQEREWEEEDKTTKLDCHKT